MSSAWQGSFNYQFEIFGLTRPVIESGPPRHGANALDNHSATELVTTFWYEDGVVLFVKRKAETQCLWQCTAYTNQCRFSSYRQGVETKVKRLVFQTEYQYTVTWCSVQVFSVPSLFNYYNKFIFLVKNSMCKTSHLRFLSKLRRWISKTIHVIEVIVVLNNQIPGDIHYKNETSHILII